MATLNEQRYQYGLSSLFWLTLAAAVLLASWRIGWVLAVVIAVPIVAIAYAAARIVAILKNR